MLWKARWMRLSLPDWQRSCSAGASLRTHEGALCTHARGKGGGERSTWSRATRGPALAATHPCRSITPLGCGHRRGPALPLHQARRRQKEGRIRSKAANGQKRAEAGTMKLGPAGAPAPLSIPPRAHSARAPGRWAAAAVFVHPVLYAQRAQEERRPRLRTRSTPVLRQAGKHRQARRQASGKQAGMQASSACRVPYVPHPSCFRQASTGRQAVADKQCARQVSGKQAGRQAGKQRALQPLLYCA